MGKIFNRRIVVILLLGFSSGLPLALSGGTLQAWLTVEGVDIKTIGLFSLVGLPYTLKFLWSPILDRFSVPLFGRRRGWVFIFILGRRTNVRTQKSTNIEGGRVENQRNLRNIDEN